MNPQIFANNDLWKLFMLLVNMVLFLVIITFMYLMLEDHINTFLNKPSYTEEQLEEMLLKRERQKRIERNDNWDLVERGIHLKTGLKADKNLSIVIAACTSCHSAKLITQNRATRAGWKNMIVWMQATQGLQDLGEQEPLILDYLATYYAPTKMGRRKNLDMAAIEWYILNVEE